LGNKYKDLRRAYDGKGQRLEDINNFWEEH